MADKVVSSPVVVAASGASAAVPAGTPKKAAIAKSAKPRTKPAHPKTAEMVNSAIKALKERGGSSVQAIKKYMVSTYKVNAEQQATFIKKYLKAAVASGVLIQTKGKGAAGSFKLSATKTDAVKPKAKLASKAAASKKVAVAKKSVAAKKPTSVAAKKVPAKKGSATATSEKKKKVTKGPAAKPPKAKTTKAKVAAKTPVKTKAVATKKTKPAAAKPKKVVSKKATASKK